VTNGKKLITAAFFLGYVVPAAGNLLFGDKIITIYRQVPLTIYSVLLIAGAYAGFVVASAVRVRLVPPLSIWRVRSVLCGLGTLHLRSRVWIATVTLLLQGAFFTVGLNNYRYATETISDVNSPLLLIGAIANVVITVDLFYWMFVRPDVPSAFSRRYLESVLLSLTLVISANGTASMMLALFAMSYSLFPVRFKRLAFVPYGCRPMRRIRTLITAATILVVIFPFSWVCGETIKATSRGDVSLIDAAANVVDGVRSDDRFVENYLYYFVSSISSYYYSFLFAADAAREELVYEGISPIVLPIQTFLFRLDYMLGRPNEIERPMVGSLSRWNYVVMTTEQPNPRAGTSPGVLASFIYVFGVPFSLLFCALYLRWLSNATNQLVRRHGPAVFSEFGVLLFLLFVYDVFQSPFDIFIGFDNSVLYRLLLLGLVVAQWTRQQPALARMQDVSWTARRERSCA
jgi:hypothetical protein